MLTIASKIHKGSAASKAVSRRMTDGGSQNSLFGNRRRISRSRVNSSTAVKNYFLAEALALCMSTFSSMGASELARSVRK